MSKQGFTILLVVVAFVAFYGGFLYGRNQQTASDSAAITPVPTPTPTNPLGNIKTNPFEDVKFNPFK